MKRLICLVILTAAVLMIFTGALAESAAVYDGAGVLSKDEIGTLEERLARIREEYDFQVTVYTVGSLSGKELRVEAADWFDAHESEFGKNGVTLAICTGPRYYDFVTSGTGMRIFSDEDGGPLAAIEDRVLPYLRNNQWMGAVSQYVLGAEERLSSSGQALINSPSGLLKAAEHYAPHAGIIGALASTLILLIRISRMKTGKKQQAANQYMTDAQLTRRSDVYLYTTETKQRIQTNTGSGSHGGGGHSGSFHSSGGVSHGGRGGSF